MQTTTNIDEKTCKSLVSALIDATDKALQSGVKLLAFLGQNGLPLQAVKPFFQSHTSWPKNEKLEPVGDNRAAGTKAGNAWGSLKKAAQRYAGEGEGIKFVPAFPLAPVVKSEPAPKTQEEKGRDEAQGPTAKDLETVKHDAEKKAYHLAALQFMGMLDRQRATVKGEEAVAVLNALKAEIAKTYNLSI